MEFKILRIYELNGVLRVETECAYGKDNLGLSLKQKYLDPVTQKPRYLAEVKQLLEAKYNQQLATEQEVVDEYVGQTINTDDI